MFNFNEDSGRGNLNVRAYIASLVGPRRTASGQRIVKPITDQGSAIAKSGVQGSEVVYVEAWLSQRVLSALPGGGAFIAFSSSENTGENAQQLLLSATQRYSGILLPDEQLYAAVITDALGAPIAGKVNLVVSTAVF